MDATITTSADDRSTSTLTPAARRRRPRRFPIRGVLIAALVIGYAGGKVVDGFGPGDAIVQVLHCPGSVRIESTTVSKGRYTTVVRHRTTTRTRRETTSICTFADGSTKTVSDLTRTVTIDVFTGSIGLIAAAGLAGLVTGTRSRRARSSAGSFTATA